MKRYSENQNFIVFWVILGVSALLQMNTNHNAMPWIMRICKPLSINGMTVYWGNIVLVILIYNVFKKFYQLKSWKALNKDWKCFVWTLVFIVGCSSLGEVGIQGIKSFQEGLKAIYLQRDATGGSLKWEMIESEGKKYKRYTGQVYITVKNCSRKETQQFEIRVEAKNLTNEEIEYSFESEESYILEPNEIRRIEIDSFKEEKVEEEEETYSSGMSNFRDVKVILHNEDEELVFEKEYS